MVFGKTHFAGTLCLRQPALSWPPAAQKLGQAGKHDLTLRVSASSNKLIFYTVCVLQSPLRMELTISVAGKDQENKSTHMSS